MHFLIGILICVVTAVVAAAWLLYPVVGAVGLLLIGAVATAGVLYFLWASTDSQVKLGDF